MVLDDLGSSLRGTLDDLRGKSRLSEEDIEDIVKEIQRSLLQADVDVGLVQDLSDSIETRALEEEPPAGTTPRDWVLRIVYEELVELVGESTELPLEEQTIMLAGLYGSGKTTTAAKMAWWFSTKGLRPAIIQTDTDRPGAYDQAKEMAERAEVDFYGDPDADDPVEIAREGLEATDDAEVRIVDTAGRDALNQELVDQIEDIEAAANPDRNLLVIDAAMGQSAKDQAREFEAAIGIEERTPAVIDVPTSDSGPKQGDRRYYEATISPGDEVFVSGVAGERDADTELVVTDSADNRLLISDEGQSGATRNRLFGVVVLSVAGILLLWYGVAPLL
jgi:signal recognition particle subunit SRP54